MNEAGIPPVESSTAMTSLAPTNSGGGGSNDSGWIFAACLGVALFLLSFAVCLSKVFPSKNMICTTQYRLFKFLILSFVFQKRSKNFRVLSFKVLSNIFRFLSLRY